MRQIREVLRQKWELGLSNRQVGRGCGISRPTVAECVKRAEAAGLSRPLPVDLDNSEPDRKLFPPAVAIAFGQRAMPDWSVVNQEFRRPGVTLALLWDEYKAANPEGYQYSWFCEHYRCWLGKVDVGNGLFSSIADFSCAFLRDTFVITTLAANRHYRSFLFRTDRDG